MKQVLIVLISLAIISGIGYFILNDKNHNPIVVQIDSNYQRDLENTIDADERVAEVLNEVTEKAKAEDPGLKQESEVTSKDQILESAVEESNGSILELVHTSNNNVDSNPVSFSSSTNADLSNLITNKRIVAFYGNFYSPNMGILGEYDQSTLINKLQNVAREWEIADPSRQVIPAIHYIASTAQPTPTNTGLYTMRMPGHQILRAIALGETLGGITILDLQPGQGDILTEVQILEKYLSLPNVNLGIDPEFVMRPGHVPGEYVGTIDASQVNQVIDYLSNVVVENNLPPKVLLLHRFTQKMVTNAGLINQTPQVTTIIEMDGWGSPALKRSTYQAVITSEDIPYSGFKIFYKNDLRPPSDRLITPEEVLQLEPQPIYVQYQ